MDRIPLCIEKAKDKNDPFRLMGFGHRVYKNFDPRARIMQKICHEVVDVVGKGNQPLLELAIELEKVALKDDYFIKRKLYPNVDFYTGIVYKVKSYGKCLVSNILSYLVNWDSYEYVYSYVCGCPKYWLDRSVV